MKLTGDSENQALKSRTNADIIMNQLAREQFHLDFEAALASGEPGEPDWWMAGGQVVAAAGAHEVWPMRGGEGLTALCYVDPTRIWEVAGPRLPEE